MTIGVTHFTPVSSATCTLSLSSGETLRRRGCVGRAEVSFLNKQGGQSGQTLRQLAVRCPTIARVSPRSKSHAICL